MMKDRLITTTENPTTEESIMVLLAAYFALNVEYPSAYMQFLRALERLTTGNIAPSKYGNTRAKFERFISMLKSVEKKTGQKRKK